MVKRNNRRYRARLSLPGPSLSFILPGVNYRGTDGLLYKNIYKVTNHFSFRKISIRSSYLFLLKLSTYATNASQLFWLFWHVLKNLFSNIKSLKMLILFLKNEKNVKKKKLI